MSDGNSCTINKRTVTNCYKINVDVYACTERSPAFFCSQLPNHAGQCLYTPSPSEVTYSSRFGVQCLGAVGPAKTREQTSILTWQHYCDIYSITISGITDMTIAMCMYCMHFKHIRRQCDVWWCCKQLGYCESQRHSVLRGTTLLLMTLYIS